MKQETLFISFCTQKGGVGKSTMTVLAAACLHDCPSTAVEDVKSFLTENGFASLMMEIGESVTD